MLSDGINVDHLVTLTLWPRWPTGSVECFITTNVLLFLFHLVSICCIFVSTCQLNPSTNYYESWATYPSLLHEKQDASSISARSRSGLGSHVQFMSVCRHFGYLRPDLVNLNSVRVTSPDFASDVWGRDIRAVFCVRQHLRSVTTLMFLTPKTVKQL